MGALIDRLITAALQHRVYVLGLTALLAAAGIWSFVTLNTDAFPDLSPNQVLVMTTVPGLSPAEIEQQVRRIEKIETALEPHFQQLFINAMALPNKVDPFPKLAEQVKLPPRKVLAEGEGGDATPRRRSREERAARRARD